ncbi:MULTISPECIES: adenylyl-sulfate kinase [unclassified Bradyrhizobium]|uniref:adenylyl-sulfate kinase n=1 Tax=unclassified Bradyrhizobium TaxID=2631580 RepID=UPI0028E23644|nr:MULTISPECIES: adenylyl-sulfate kinase [unclassified Bradyrhizobium]
MSIEEGGRAVFWITGLPRSGKTTLAGSLCAALRKAGRPVVALDGDAFRAACGNDLGYDDASRLQNARRLSGMCQLLSSQGLIVVCSTVSLFEEVHAWNRSNIEGYLEVVLNVSIDTLNRRDPILYGAAHRGEALLPGVNQEYSLPTNPDFFFEELTSDLNLEAAVAQLLASVNTQP